MKATLPQIQSSTDEKAPQWPVVKLSDVCGINPGKPKTDALAADAPVSFVPMAAVSETTGSIIGAEDRPFASVRGSYTAFRDGDVIFAKITPCMENGKSAIAQGLTNGLGFGSSEFHVLRPGPRILPEFIYQLVRQESFRGEAKDNMTGSVGQARVPTDFLKNYEIELPSIEEQRRIMDAVRDLQEQVKSAHERLAAIPTLLRRFRQSVLAAACSGQLTTDWREETESDQSVAHVLDEVAVGRATHSSGRQPQRAWSQAERLFDIPESWRWVTLREVAALKGGVTKGQQRNRDKTLVSVPYLRVANVQRGYLDLEEVKKIEVTPEEVDALSLRRGDILFNEGGDRDKLGRGWIWEGQIPLCIHQNHVFRGRLYSDHIPAKLISWYGNSFGAQHFIDQGKQTVNLASLSITKLGDMSLPLAPPAEMAEIVRRIETLFALADSIESRVVDATAQVKRTSQSILAKALRGCL